MFSQSSDVERPSLNRLKKKARHWLNTTTLVNDRQLDDHNTFEKHCQINVMNFIILRCNYSCVSEFKSHLINLSIIYETNKKNYPLISTGK